MLRVVVEFRDERAQAAVVLSEEGGDRLPLAAREWLCVGHLRVAAERDEWRRDLERGQRAQTCGRRTDWWSSLLGLLPRSLLVPNSMTLLSLTFAAQPAPYLVRTACAHFDRNSCIMHNGAPPQPRCLASRSKKNLQLTRGALACRVLLEHRQEQVQGRKVVAEPVRRARREAVRQERPLHVDRLGVRAEGRRRRRRRGVVRHGGRGREHKLLCHTDLQVAPLNTLLHHHIDRWHLHRREHLHGHRVQQRLLPFRRQSLYRARVPRQSCVSSRPRT